jgi:hypothetical protein
VVAASITDGKAEIAVMDLAWVLIRPDALKVTSADDMVTVLGLLR